MKVKLLTALLTVVLAFGGITLIAAGNDDFCVEHDYCVVTIDECHTNHDDCCVVISGDHLTNHGHFTPDSSNPGTCSGCCWGGVYTPTPPCPGCGLIFVLCYQSGTILFSFRMCIGIC